MRDKHDEAFEQWEKRIANETYAAWSLRECMRQAFLAGASHGIDISLDIFADETEKAND